MKYQVWADGGSKGNGTPNQDGYGSYLVKTETGDTKRKEFKFGNVSNNVAEGKILIQLLEDIVTADHLMNNAHVIVYMDSQLVVNMFNQAWDGKKLHMQELRDEALDLQRWVKAVLDCDVECHQITGDGMKSILGH